VRVAVGSTNPVKVRAVLDCGVFREGVIAALGRFLHPELF
jgi:non-canonical (house-cleaning) NTP pyrophosphatase